MVLNFSVAFYSLFAIRTAIFMVMLFPHFPSLFGVAVLALCVELVGALVPVEELILQFFLAQFEQIFTSSII